MSLKIINNEQLINHIFEYNVILFGLGINNSSGNGFSKELFTNFPDVYESENNTKYGDLRKYGTINETKTNGIIICSCYVYKNSCKKHKNDSYIDYEYLKQSLLKIQRLYKGMKIASPIIGNSIFDGNGDKNKILEIFNEVFGEDDDITLYDFEQKDSSLVYYQELGKLKNDLKNKVISNKEYAILKKKLKNIRKYGIYGEKNLDVSKK